MQRQQRQNSPSEEMTTSVVGICIVALPLEYRTCAEIKDLVENILNIGVVASVYPVETMAKSGVAYKSANVLMSSLTNQALLADFERDEGRANVNMIRGVTMSWDNGRPMDHLSIRRLADVSRWDYCSPNYKLELSEDAWTSMHIPIIPKNLSKFNPSTSTFDSNPKEGFYDTESGLTHLIQNQLGLGQVKRIDFVVRDDKPGNPKAAFIHFDHWYDNKNSRYLRDRLNESGTFRQKGFYDGFNLQRFMAQNGEEQQDAYFIFKINHRPIPDVDEATCELNIHQLVASNKRLIDKVAEQDVLIASLQEQLAQIELSKTESTVNDWSDEKNTIGERIYEKVVLFEPEKAGKITGMLLELDMDELNEMIDAPTTDLLERKIVEANIVLQHA